MPLAALILFFGIQPAHPTDPVRGILRHAVAAVAGDSVAGVRARWAAVAPGDAARPAAQLGLATLARLGYDWDAARTAYASLIATHRPERVALYARLGLGELDRGQRSLDSAAGGFAAAAQEAERLGDRVAEVEALLGLALAVAPLAPLDSAIRTLARAQRILPSGEPGLEASLRCRRAQFLVTAGKPGGRADAETGLAIARRQGDLRLQGLCWQALGFWTLINVDDPVASAAPFDSAESSQRRAGDLAGLAESLVWSGWDHFSFFNNGAAKADFLAGAELARRSGNRFAEAWAARMLGNLALRTGAFPQAAQHFTRDATLARALGDRRELVHIARSRGNLELGLRRLATAERTFREALPIAIRLEDPLAISAIRQGLLWVTGARGDWTGANRQLDSVLAFMRRHQLQGLLPGLRYTQGVLALRVGRLEQARAHFEWYLRSSSPSEFVGRYQSRSRLAEIHLRSGQVDRALAELTSASDHLDSLRAGLSDAELRILAFQTGGSKSEESDYGFATLIAGFVAGGRAAPAFRLAERRRARELTDRLLRTTREHPDSGPLLAAVPAAAATEAPETNLRVPDDSTALLEYVAGRDGQPSSVFALVGDRLSAYVLPSLDSLAPRIERFLGLLHSGGNGGPLGARLRAALLDSVLPRLPARIRRLLIVPDDVLHRLPFDALGFDDGRPLVSRYAVALVPSARIATTLSSPAAAPSQRAILALGDPVFPAARPTPAEPASAYQTAFAATGGLPRLPFSASEARAVGRFAKRSAVKLRGDASEATVKQATFRDVAIVHFATHALIDDWLPEGAALALAPGAGEDGFLSAGELLELALPVDLVVLSACRTASGPLVGGEGVQGLTAPLLAAGARAVVATHWPIRDRATRPFVRRLYEALAEGQPLIDALQTAKLDAIRRGAGPAGWAAFVAVGDPRVRLPLERPGRPRWAWVVVLGVVAAAGLLLARRLRVTV